MAADITGPGLPTAKGAVTEPDGFEEYAGPMVDIASLKHAARRGRKFWVAAALAGLVLGAAFHLFVPAKFAAVTDLYMAEPTGSDPTAAIANDVSLLGTRSVAQQAIKALHLKTSPTAFVSTYQGTSVSDVILSVKLSATSPAEAVAYDNAVARAFLSVRSNELALQTQLVVNSLEAQVKSLNGQISSLTSAIGSLSAAKAGSQSANQVAALVDQRTNDASQITELQSQEQQDFLIQQSAVQGTHVLDPAVALKTSATKVIVEDALTGLVGGLLLGLGIVVVAGIISDRPRLRTEVAAALGVPVELSVGPTGRRCCGAGPGCADRAPAGHDAGDDGPPSFPPARCRPPVLPGRAGHRPVRAGGAVGVVTGPFAGLRRQTGGAGGHGRGAPAVVAVPGPGPAGDAFDLHDRR